MSSTNRKKTLLVMVGSRCNNNCLMCSVNRGIRMQNESSERLAKIIKERSCDYEEIEFTGGEPTIREDFYRLVELASDNYKHVAVSSNLRLFSYPEHAKRAAESGLKLATTSLHGTEEIHNAITRTPNSFEQTIKGIKNILQRRNNSHVIGLRLVLLRQNYKELEKISKFIHSEFGRLFRGHDKIAYIFPEYEGRAKKNIDKVGIRYSEVKPYMENVLRKWPGRFRENLFAFHFPLCTIDPTLWKYVVRSIPADDDEYIFLEKCNNCIYKKYCVSIHNDYIEEFGSDEFTPFTKEVANRLVINEDNFFKPIKDS